MGLIMCDELDIDSLMFIAGEAPPLAQLLANAPAATQDFFMLLWLPEPEVVVSDDPRSTLLRRLLHSVELTRLRAFTESDSYSAAVGVLLLSGLVESEDASSIEDKLDQAQGQLARTRAAWSAWGVTEQELEQLSFEERRAAERTLSAGRVNRYLALLGRLRLLEAGLRSRRLGVRDGVDDVELSDRLEDVLPEELAGRGHRLQRLEFLARLADGQLLTRRFVGQAPTGRGPVVLLVDESESMLETDVNGLPREAWAKALALALLQRARAEGRDATYIAFSSTGQQAVWRFLAGRRSVADLLSLAQHFFCGSTDYESALDLAMDEVAASTGGRADVVLVTDDTQSVRSAWSKSYQTRREQLDVRVFGVSVGVQSEGTLRKVCDDVRSVVNFVDDAAARGLLQLV